MASRTSSPDSAKKTIVNLDMEEKKSEIRLQHQLHKSLMSLTVRKEPVKGNFNRKSDCISAQRPGLLLCVNFSSNFGDVRRCFTAMLTGSWPEKET